MMPRSVTWCALSLVFGALAACGDSQEADTGQISNTGSGGQPGAAGSAGAAGSMATAGSAGNTATAGGAGVAGGGLSGSGGAGGAGAPGVCDPDAACFSCCHFVGPQGAQPSCKDASCTVDCGLASPCALLNLYTPMTPDPAIVACVMGVLRDGTAAQVSWQGPGTVPGGDEGATFHVLAGRKALVSAGQGFDLGGNITTLTGPGPLKPASFFEDCAKQTDRDALIECMRNVVDSCATP